MMESNLDWTYAHPNGTENQDKKSSLFKKFGKWPSFKLSKRTENMIVRAVVLAGDLIPDELVGGTQPLRCSGKKALPTCSVDCEYLV
mmetsp:Transcript_16895/g.34039  ORF Transcript_16895/g.34039 Transcript_16895/m.34039 type:complete len:87 (-) Transcript_16895:54-314(-)|eukprot:scaffold34608_cov172-Amphora_coffeaeformis.AAC.3